MQGHKHLPSKNQKRLLKRKAIINSPQEGRGSIFKFLSPLWRALTPEQKQVWKDAGAVSGLTNWQLFVSDNSARIQNSLELGVPPSELWQVRTGYLTIFSPASEIILRQEHPLNYWISDKVPGASWKNEPVLITEQFSFPLTISIRYKSDLTSTGGADIARYYARVWTSYQGEDIYTDYAIDFDLDTDWKFATLTIQKPRGIIVGYTLFIHIEGYTGELFFDNIRAVHGGTNWARDPRCDDISKEFSGAFALVPPFWIADSLPEGASFSSVFPPSL